MIPKYFVQPPRVRIKRTAGWQHAFISLLFLITGVIDSTESRNKGSSIEKESCRQKLKSTNGLLPTPAQEGVAAHWAKMGKDKWQSSREEGRGKQTNRMRWKLGRLGSARILLV